MEDTDTLTEVKLECPNGCGTSFTDPSRLEYHVENSCKKTKANGSATRFTVNRTPSEDRPEPKASQPVQQPKASTPAKVSKLPASTNAVDAMKAERTKKWTGYIKDDLNPFLFKFVQNYAQIPDEWCDGVIGEYQLPDGKTVKLWEPPLRQRLTFSDSESEKLAKAAAHFSVSPMGIAITAWVESNAGLIALGTAAFVAAKYGWRVMQTKGEVAQLQQMMKQQQEMMMAQRSAMGDNPNGAAA